MLDEITSWFIHFLDGNWFSSSLFSISMLAAISSRTSAKGGIFKDSSTLMKSPFFSSLKRKPPMREKSSIPVRKSNDDNRRTGLPSSDAAIYSHRKSKVRPNGLAMHLKSTRIYLSSAAYIASRDNCSSLHSGTNRRASSTTHHGTKSKCTTINDLTIQIKIRFFRFDAVRMPKYATFVLQFCYPI